MRGKFYWKKYQNARSFFLSHTSKLNQQKKRDVVSKSTAKIYPSNKYNIFPSFIIDQSWNTSQLKNIVLGFHPPFEPITALFTVTGLWPYLHFSYVIGDFSELTLRWIKSEIIFCSLSFWSISNLIIRQFFAILWYKINNKMVVSYYSP